MANINFKPKGKRSAKGHPAGHVRIVTTDGAFLHSYDSGWLEVGDDPTCWTEDATKALWLSPEDAARIMRANGACGFQAASIERE
jgi:hypothetical protein